MALYKFRIIIIIIIHFLDVLKSIFPDKRVENKRKMTFFDVNEKEN